MANVLSEDKKQQVIALGRLGWSLRRIEQATGVRRETASSYLKAGREMRTVHRHGAGGNQASFALVSEEAGATDAGIELVLGDGRRLRIRQGVDEETLRSVLAALERARC